MLPPLNYEFWNYLRVPSRAEIESSLLDREQIRAQLGLLPHAEYLSQSNIREGDRRSGRTTEMILDMLVAAQTKLVYVDSYRNTPFVVDEARRYAARTAYINPNKIRRYISRLDVRGAAPNSYQISVDHAELEHGDRPRDRRTGAKFLRDLIEANRLRIDTFVPMRSIEEHAREYAAWEEQNQLPGHLRTFSHHDFEPPRHARSLADLNWEEYHRQQEFLINRTVRARFSELLDTSNLKSTSKPPACQGCKNYNGSSYGGNLLICGMYPYGCDSDVCPDWESKTMVLIDLLSIEQNPNYLKDNERICIGKTIRVEWRGRLPEYLEDCRNIQIIGQESNEIETKTTFIVHDHVLLDRLRTTYGIINVNIENHWQTVEYAFPKAKYFFKYQNLKCSCGFKFEYQHHDNCPSCDRVLDVDVESIEDAIARRDKIAP
jgi:hypothetical protein